MCLGRKTALYSHHFSNRGNHSHAVVAQHCLINVEEETFEYCTIRRKEITTNAPAPLMQPQKPPQ